MTSACQSSFYNQKTSLKSDCCEQTWKDRSNQFISDYRLDFPPSCLQNPGFLCEPGMYEQIPPLMCEKICDSSGLRNGCYGNQLTHTGQKRQLPVRPFRTVPYMGSCRAPLMNPDTYSKLISGESTRTGKSCDSLSGVTIDRFEPLVPCLKYNIQNPVHYIPEYWVRGGMDTRSYIRNTDYLKACGIKKCESSCEKAFCSNLQLPASVALQKGQTANLPCMPNACVLKFQQ